MGSEFDDIFAEVGFPTLQSGHGTRVSYYVGGRWATPAPKPIPCVAVVEVSGSQLVEGAAGTMIEDSNWVQVSAEDVPNPTHKDEILIDGVMWEVVTVPDAVGGTYRFPVRRAAATEYTAPNFRER